MKRNLIVVLVLALALTACVPAANQTQNNNQTQSVVVNVEVVAPQAPNPVAPTSPTAAPEPTPTAIFSSNPLQEPIQLQDVIQSVKYPKITKGILADGTYVCVAVGVGVHYPDGFSEIESHSKNTNDGNYITADTSNAYSMNRFCAGTKPSDHLGPKDASWKFGFITADGVKFVEGFGPDTVVP